MNRGRHRKKLKVFKSIINSNTVNYTFKELKIKISIPTHINNLHKNT